MSDPSSAGEASLPPRRRKGVLVLVLAALAGAGLGGGAVSLARRLDPPREDSPVAPPAPALASTPRSVKANAARPGAPARYACPMHPEVVSDRAGDRCPICGMELVPAPVAPGP